MVRCWQRRLGLDMARAGWAISTANYLGRVTKAHVPEAVREAMEDAAADRSAGLKKPDMAEEQLPAGTGCLPELPRRRAMTVEDTPQIELVVAGDGTLEPAPAGVVAQSAQDGGETAMGDPVDAGDDEPVTDAAFTRTAAE
jgi:ParB family chromosome partitioning protein